MRYFILSLISVLFFFVSCGDNMKTIGTAHVDAPVTASSVSEQSGSATSTLTVSGTGTSTSSGNSTGSGSSTSGSSSSNGSSGSNSSGGTSTSGSSNSDNGHGNGNSCSNKGSSDDGSSETESSDSESDSDSSDEASQCSDMSGHPADEIKISGNHSDQNIKEGHSVYLRVTGNQSQVTLTLDSNSGAAIPAVCVFAAGNQPDVNIVVNGEVQHLFIVERGNQSKVSVDVAKGGAVDNSISADLKGHNPTLDVSGAGSFTCPAASAGITCSQ